MSEKEKRNILNELRILIKGKPSESKQLSMTKDDKSLVEFLEELTGSSLVDMSQLNQFRTIASDRESQYRLYDEMCNDTIIASALEMYADDATQYNSKGQVIWAESSNTDIADFANRLIDVLDLNKNTWSYIYSLVKYGDVYLETFKDDEIDDDPLIKIPLDYTTATISKHKIGAYIEEYIEKVPNPAELFDLTSKGKTVGFIRTPNENVNVVEPRYYYQQSEQSNETLVLPSDKFIHISLSNNTERFPEKLEISFQKDGSIDTDIKTRTYKINRGKSVLYDLYKSYKEMQLMEDSLLLNRVTRSSIIRLLQVEVGDMPKANVHEFLKRIKNMIEQKNYMDKNDGTYSSLAGTGPIDNVIYIPTRDGKGQVSSSNLGGDIDVKSITDVDYFKNKFYGGIKIPKQFLGDTDDTAGFSGGTSLTKLDSRYARTVKRIQTAYIEGITALINLFAYSKGLSEYINEFTIKMVSPSTVEDQERDETMSSRMGLVNDILSLFSDEQLANAKTRKEVMIYLINNYLSEPELADMLKADTTINESETDEVDEFDSGFDDDNFDSDFGSPSGFDRPSNDFGGESMSDSEFNDFGSMESQDNFSADTQEMGGEETGGFEPIEPTEEF